MMSGIYRLRYDDNQELRVTSSELRRFRDLCLVRMPKIRKFPDRISLCLWLNLLALNKRYGIAPPEVFDAIFHLEEGEPVIGLKPATRFKRKPLKGLWHKHWFSAHFLAANMLTAIKHGIPKEWASEIIKEGEYPTEESLGRLAERFTTTAFEERYRRNEVTGEWVIFVKHGGANYYLCLATHDTGDQRIYETIINGCRADYPEIARWIADASKERIVPRSRSRREPE